jgi:hypothetical protein
MKENQQEQMRFLPEVRQMLLDAGYLEVMEAPQGQRLGCDLVAYASGSNKGTIGAVVEVKLGVKVNMAVEAAKLDLARSRAGVSGGLLFTDSGIFDLTTEGTGFTQVEIVPRVVLESAPVGSQHAIDTFMWNVANELRGSTGSGGFIEKLISVIVAENGIVTLPGSPMKISGPAFREFLSRRASLGKMDSLESQSSLDTQAVFTSLAKLFPDTTSIFDPFFGMGFSAFAAVDALKPFSAIEKVSGFEVNHSSFELAEKLSATVEGLKEFRVELGSSIDRDWPESDLLLAEPPLGLRLPAPISISSVSVRDIEAYTLLKTAVEVRDGVNRKVAIILTGRGWLVRDRDQQLRDKLVELGVVRAVLGLPGLKANTSIPLVAIVLARGDSQVVLGELLEDWRDQLTGDVGNLHDLLKL